MADPVADPLPSRLAETTDVREIGGYSIEGNAVLSFEDETLARLTLRTNQEDGTMGLIIMSIDDGLATFEAGQYRYENPVYTDKVSALVCAGPNGQIAFDSAAELISIEVQPTEVGARYRVELGSTEEPASLVVGVFEMEG